MKIALIGLPQLQPGKVNIKDSRLDEVAAITKSKKTTYLQVELSGEEALFEADAVLAATDSRTDLILKDLEFAETRIARTEDAQEKAVLEKLKAGLEKEIFANAIVLTPEEKQALSGHGLVTGRPVVVVTPAELEERDALLAKAVKEGGYSCFFTTGEKETRSWLIRQGTTAWEAAGVIHSDIQRGFIRAEIISLKDFMGQGGESRAKQAGKLRLEQKEYVMQEGDLANFRFNK